MSSPSSHLPAPKKRDTLLTPVSVGCPALLPEGNLPVGAQVTNGPREGERLRPQPHLPHRWPMLPIPASTVTTSLGEAPLSHSHACGSRQPDPQAQPPSLKSGLVRAVECLDMWKGAWAVEAALDRPRSPGSCSLVLSRGSERTAPAAPALASQFSWSY